LAIQILQVLERGSFVATYKYAVLLALLDLSVEHTRRNGEPSDTFTTRQLAEKVIELYWGHARPYPEVGAVLRQNTGRQATILHEIEGWQRRFPDRALLTQARRSAEFEDLVDEVEWVLIHMPLPKLQRVGKGEHRFLYEIDWSDDVERKEGWIRAYQRSLRGDAGADAAARSRGRRERLAGPASEELRGTTVPVGSRASGGSPAPASGSFDNRIRLRPGVGEGLIALSGLLRPLIEERWTAMVSSINKLPEAKLGEFLFGSERVDSKPVRAGLRQLQAGRCFYCGRELQSTYDVDHFLPWALHREDAIENLVLADRACNGKKKHHLASQQHLESWLRRIDGGEPSAAFLSEIADQASWETDPERVVSIARATYLRLPEGTPLWQGGEEFRAAEPGRIVEILAGWSGGEARPGALPAGP